MLKKKIQSLLIKLGLVLVITVSLFNIGAKLGTNSRIAYANSNTYSVSQSVNQQEIKDTIKQIQSDKKMSNEYDVLIYHSHTHEAYRDTNIVLIGNDLKTKLETKGLKVKVINEDFTKNDYNNSYYESRKMLKTELQNNNYKLVIDYHCDALPEGKKVTGTDIHGNSTSKLMFVTTTQNPNYKENRKCIDEIKEYIDKFGDNITRKTWEYKHGISYYSSDLGNKNGDGNVILLENGFNTNNETELKRSNTYLSSAIKQYIDNYNIKN